MAKSKSKTSVKKNVKGTTKPESKKVVKIVGEKKTTTKKAVTKKVVAKKVAAKKIATKSEVEIEPRKEKTHNSEGSFWARNKVLLIVLAAIALLLVYTIFSEGSDTKDEGASAEVATNPSVSEWVSDTKSEQYVITVIALSYCTYCQQFKPVITDLAASNGIKLYWYEIDTLQETNSEDANILTSTYNLEQYNGSSPYTAITYGGTFIKDVVGYMPEEETKTFLKEAGVIN